MKGTVRSLDYLRGDQEIEADRHRSRGACPICFERLMKYLEEKIEGGDKDEGK